MCVLGAVPDLSLFCRVQITVVDVYGQRHVLRALTGHTLVDVLTEHQELLGSEGTARFTLRVQLNT